MREIKYNMLSANVSIVLDDIQEAYLLIFKILEESLVKSLFFLHWRFKERRWTDILQDLLRRSDLGGFRSTLSRAAFR